MQCRCHSAVVPTVYLYVMGTTYFATLTDNSRANSKRRALDVDHKRLPGDAAGVLCPVVAVHVQGDAW